MTTKAETKPTPGPWTLEHDFDFDGDYFVLAGRKIITVTGSDTDEDQANAEFIVRACNSHPALLEALEGLYSVVNLIGWSPIRDLDERMEAARIALQKGQP